jgi:nucleolar protein 58
LFACGRFSVKLVAFSKFEDTNEALEAAAAMCEGKLDKGLKSFLKKAIVKKELTDQLGVIDAKLGNLIKTKLEIDCVNDNSINELMRGIRTQMSALISGLTEADYRSMVLGLAHSLGRYKIKFSPDKVDTMIIQAIGLLDELDKELNTYAMRVREWYGWHFPEMSKVVTENILFAKSVRKMGLRTAASKTDLSDILPEEMETALKEAAEISMGTEISAEDLSNIQALCDQVIAISDYRNSLFDYLKNRMNAIAPNLSVMVGELVGARLIAHAGSLLNLAKHPASTVQILGAEKALFRALKTKHETPKYGLLYHASLVGQAGPKLKGKMARVLAAKTALSIRVDALGEGADGDASVGHAHREAVEARLRQLESGKSHSLSGSAKGKPKQEKFTPKANAGSYNAASDNTMASSKKRKADDEEEDEEAAAAAKKARKEAKRLAKLAAGEDEE